MKTGPRFKVSSETGEAGDPTCVPSLKGKFFGSK